MLRKFDSKLLSFIQNWIADPLQWSWVKLDWQIRSAMCLIVAGVVGYTYLDILKLSYFVLAIDGFLFIFGLKTIVYGVPTYRKLLASTAYSIWGIFYLIMLVFSLIFSLSMWPFSASFRDYCFLSFSLGCFLEHYLLRCKPKPPTENRKLAQNSI